MRAIPASMNVAFEIISVSFSQAQYLSLQLTDLNLLQVKLFVQSGNHHRHQNVEYSVTTDSML